MKTKLIPLLVALATVFFGRMPAPAQGVEQTLRPGDSIALKISGVPPEEIAVVNNTYDIADGGTINLPYIGKVRAGGLRPSQLQENIEGAYKNAEIFTHPTIQVTTNKEGGGGTQVLYVSGEVKTPGRVLLAPGMTAHQAMTSAGGPTDFAKLKAVKFTRGGTTRILDLRKADGADAAIQVRPGDQIHIPQ
ncbi:MAG: polysaccharide biosynthesis/export family protein [Verrucomicrobia bacterium]|nr:polysaccharide biosynthesis/export family protein [Verrucomicrobiota bacterium]